MERPDVSPGHAEQPALDFAVMKIANRWYTALRDRTQPAALREDATADEVAELARCAVAALAGAGLLQVTGAQHPAAGQLRTAAAARREYADQPAARSAGQRPTLRAQAAMLEQAARVVDGDIRPLCGWLPVEQWTEQMLGAVTATSPTATSPTATSPTAAAPAAATPTAGADPGP